MRGRSRFPWAVLVLSVALSGCSGATDDDPSADSGPDVAGDVQSPDAAHPAVESEGSSSPPNATSSAEGTSRKTVVGTCTDTGCGPYSDSDLGRFKTGEVSDLRVVAEWTPKVETLRELRVTVFRNQKEVGTASGPSPLEVVVSDLGAGEYVVDFAPTIPGPVADQEISWVAMWTISHAT